MSPFCPALTEDDVILADKLRGVSNVRDDTFNTSKMKIEPINAAPMYALSLAKGKEDQIDLKQVLLEGCYGELGMVKKCTAESKTVTKKTMRNLADTRLVSDEFISKFAMKFNH